MSISRAKLNKAASDHLLSGHPITRIEALILFGVSNLPALITDLRRKGFTIKTRKVTYALTMRRINQVASLAAPKDLPIREITFTEYRAEQ
jgi:hypothetical protein